MTRPNHQLTMCFSCLASNGENPGLQSRTLRWIRCPFLPRNCRGHPPILEGSHRPKSHRRSYERVLSHGLGRIVSVQTFCSSFLSPHTEHRWPSLPPSFLYKSFFNNVLRIGAPGYVPTETDVLRARQKSVGITETRFSMGQLSWVLTSSSLSTHTNQIGGNSLPQNTHVWRRWPALWA